MRPACHQLLTVSILSVILCTSMHAQSGRPSEPGKDSLVQYIRSQYGLDQELYNGYQVYTHLLKYKGDPFIPEDAFYAGSVSVGGARYEEVRLKYNGFSQRLILEYTDLQDRYNQIELISTRIDSFRMGAYRFKKLSLVSGRSLFYQELKAGSLTCYIHWRKDIHATRDDMQYSHEYSRPLGTFYLSYKGVLHTFSNRNSYLLLFPEAVHAGLKKYFRQEHLSLKKAASEDIQKLLRFTDELTATLPGP
jgi:hypothetical protein